MKIFSFLGLVLAVILVSGIAGAANVRLDGVSSDQQNPTLVSGSVVSFDILGENFPATSSGDITLNFGPDGVLNFSDFTEAVIWDTSSSITPFEGNDALIGVGSSGADPVGNFVIGTIEFNVSGVPGESTSMTIADFTGFSAPDASAINVTYAAAHVQIGQIVPAVVGLPQSTAETNIISAGLSVGAVTNSGSATVPAGNVISQVPADGSLVAAGSAVDLLVSLGSGPTNLYEQDFEAFAVGQDPADWVDTSIDYSLVEDDSLFSVLDPGGNKVFGTIFNLRNIHSHYTGAALAGLSSYDFSGRMQMTVDAGGIGVTVFSQYPATDAYYGVLRSGSDSSFKLSSRGTGVSGVTDSGVVPLKNQWYRFRVQVTDTGSQTEIRARIWAEGASEPAGWQIDAVDASATRLSGGTIGIYARRGGSKYWDELVVTGEPGSGVLVPDVVGLSQSVAEGRILAEGLSVGTVTNANSDTVPAGDVISQSPAPGSSVGSGTAVNLVVSTGPVVTVTVPPVVGLTQGNAEAAIDSAGLSVGAIATSSSDTVPAGTVISQSPAGGTSVPSNSVVDLVVSSGITTSLYEQDFEAFAVGQDPADWVDTSIDYSLVEDDSLFSVSDLGGNKVFGTIFNLRNIHSHYTGGALAGLSSYDFSGRMQMTVDSGGIGVTVFSQYPATDAYYGVLRSGSGSSFKLSSRGTGVSGVTDSGVVPLKNQWYRFRVQVTDTGSQTEIRARIWAEGASEPAGWQIDAVDASATRLSGGTIGIYSRRGGSKYWDDLVVTGASGSGVLVPDVVGLSQSVAEGRILAEGLTLGTVTNANSDTVPAGDVISQAPAAGSSVGSGTAVNLVVSSGPVVMVTVPPVVGLTQGDAETAIDSAGLSAADTSSSSDTVAAGTVISQSPAGGTSVPSNSVVDLVVSTGIATSLYEQDFEAFAVGQDPGDWVDTGKDYSLVEDDSLFKVSDLGANKVFGTSSSIRHIHSHYTGAALAGQSGYEFSGRMQMTSDVSGIGVTVFSQYPTSDAYYGVLSPGGGRPFALTARGTGVTGDTASGVLPVKNQWYRFRVQVTDTGSQTEIRARIWAEGASEPAGWQIDVVDASATRLSSGTIGIYSRRGGSKYYDDLLVE